MPAAQVSLRPGLRWPGMTGLRVEVNGQVLSQGGDVAADQLEDTTAETHSRSGSLRLHPPLHQCTDMLPLTED